MGLINRPTQISAQLANVFKTIREGTAPDKFSLQYIKDLGFGSSNYRVVVPLLKDLGFLTQDGSPTDRYKSYLDSSRSRQVLGQAVRDAYSDIFTIVKTPKKTDKEKIAGKFKSTFNLSDLQAERSATTFLALLDLSDLDGGEEQLPVDNADPSISESYAAIPNPNPMEPTTKQGARILGLKYDIAIHLPPTKDIEVFNAIFKALKEHLID